MTCIRFKEFPIGIDTLIETYQLKKRMKTMINQLTLRLKKKWILALEIQEK